MKQRGVDNILSQYPVSQYNRCPWEMWEEIVCRKGVSAGIGDPRRDREGTGRGGGSTFNGYQTNHNLCELTAYGELVNRLFTAHQTFESDPRGPPHRSHSKASRRFRARTKPPTSPLRTYVFDAKPVLASPSRNPNSTHYQSRATSFVRCGHLRCLACLHQKMIGPGRGGSGIECRAG